MKLKKIMLHDEHEVMNASEMKQVVGGQMTYTSTCAKNGDICSGYCEDIVVKDVMTGEVTRYKQTCRAFVSANHKDFICGCDIN